MAEQIQRRVRRAEALGEASNTVAGSASDFARFLTRVSQRVAELIGDTCVIFLASDDEAWLEPVALYDQDPEVLAFTRGTLTAAPIRVSDNTMSSTVFRQSEHLLVPQDSSTSLLL